MTAVSEVSLRSEKDRETNGARHANASPLGRVFYSLRGPVLGMFSGFALSQIYGGENQSRWAVSAYHSGRSNGSERGMARRLTEMHEDEHEEWERTKADGR
eukprot:CAMPEP_0113533090 /NCGR_PEP_ID=MMETSP0015_2-20120614/4411_1 /TAXON_ID=2838 /ORGANISM="Odontella" /LENGTH=100 /DNA_ID=CAMNT_0000432103 /DNA_START=145 /DNA_END=447 /DNA_ORIENTATION=+ /assembly_acc=CAM_ASM_000160